MYFFFKIEDSQVELNVNEESFFRVANSDFIKTIALFNKHESFSVDYKISPSTVAEAKWMIYAYYSLVKLNQSIPKWLIDYFYTPFENLLDGESPAKALGLTRPPHRPKESHMAERNKKIYMEVSGLMSKGETLYNSALEVSEKYYLHESNIQKIYSAQKKAEELQEGFSDFSGEIPF
jgi:hypothetical protein